jgi:hypothetical protein
MRPNQGGAYDDPPTRKRRPRALREATGALSLPSDALSNSRKRFPLGASIGRKVMRGLWAAGPNGPLEALTPTATIDLARRTGGVAGPTGPS